MPVKVRPVPPANDWFRDGWIIVERTLGPEGMKRLTTKCTQDDKWNAEEVQNRFAKVDKFIITARRTRDTHLLNASFDRVMQIFKEIAQAAQKL